MAAVAETCALPALAFVMRGPRVSRRRISIDSVSLWDDVSVVKRKCQLLLGIGDCEVEVMWGDRTLPDGSSLLECGVELGLDDLRILAHVPKSIPELPREELADDISSTLSERSPSGSDCFDVPLLDAEWLPELCPEAEQRRPPPVLLKRVPSKRMTPNLNRGTLDLEQRDPDAEAFNLQIHCTIILNEHMHPLSTIALASGSTEVCEIEAKLKSWLGQDPDELVLLAGAEVLESNRALGDYCLGANQTLQAVAWYKHSCGLNRTAKVDLASSLEFSGGVLVGAS